MSKRSRFDYEDMKVPGTIYVLRYDRPIGDLDRPVAQAQYYMGWCNVGSLDARLEEHRRGRGARITRAFANHNIDFEVVLMMSGTRTDEARYKRWGSVGRTVRALQKSTKRQASLYAPERVGEVK